jgi:hypothetical protein
VVGLFAQNVVIDQPSNPAPLDVEGAPKFFAMIFKAYLDFHVEVKVSVIQGLRALAIERVTGTCSGPFIDPATGVSTPGNGRKFDHPGVIVIIYGPDQKVTKIEI